MLSAPSLFKEKLYRKCQQAVHEKMARLQTAYQETREALLAEAKSTAGDKHETGRAMIQLEQEKMARQLGETVKLNAMLNRVPFNKECKRVQSGALVETGQGTYFVAAALGKVVVEESEVFVLAPASPLGQALLGKETGDHFILNKETGKILGVW